MTTPNLPTSQWSVASVPDPNMSFLVLNPKDNITSPAGPNGSNQRVLFSSSLGAMVWPSGDTTGVKDTANIIAAIARVPASGGTVTLVPTAQWNVNCGQIIINRSGVYINAQGCFINAIGAGDMIRMYDPSSANGRTARGGGILGMPTVDGTNITGPSSAFHAGDILQLQCFIQVQKFQQLGSKEVWFDNNYIWTEQVKGRVYVKSGAAHVVFDNSANLSGTATGSFMRLDLDVFLETNGVGDGVVFQNGAFSADSAGHLGIWGNFSTAAAQYAVLRITGANPGGSSRMQNAGLSIGVELGDTIATAPQTIAFGAAGNVIDGCHGDLDFSLANPFASSNNSGQFLFFGSCYGDANLMTSDPATPARPQVLAANGQTIFSKYAKISRVTTTGAFTGIVMAPGTYSGQRQTIINASANSITFAAAATSNVADGAADVIAANTAASYTWDATGLLWYRS